MQIHAQQIMSRKVGWRAQTAWKRGGREVRNSASSLRGGTLNMTEEKQAMNGRDGIISLLIIDHRSPPNTRRLTTRAPEGSCPPRHDNGKHQGRAFEHE